MNQNTIYINGRFLTQRITGVQRYAMNLVIALDELIEAHEGSGIKYILLTPKVILWDLPLKNISHVRVGVLSGHLWEQIELPWFSRKGYLMSFCNTGPAFKRNQVVTICDAAVFRYPKAYGIVFVLWYRLLGNLNARFAKKIITISEFSKQELIHFLKIKENKISLVLPAVNFSGQEEDKSILEKLNLRKNGYFLAVGSLDPRKNFLGIIDAFMALKSKDIELVIVGAQNSRVFSSQRIPNDERIKWAGYLDDKQLISLYHNATSFVYPSFYEGFGIPPLEAMSLGCPAIVSNVASLPEVCGDAAFYCDPNNISSIKKAMETLLGNPDLSEELKLKGMQRATKFTYKESAKKLIDISKDLFAE